MHIGMNILEYEYQVNGTKLNTTDEEKDNGVWITKNLNRQHSARRLQHEQHEY